MISFVLRAVPHSLLGGSARRRWALLALAGLAAAGPGAAAPAVAPAPPAFAIGPDHFLLHGQPLQIRCGEMHFARVPREYWRHRLQAIRAMGLNAVCAYLFWNFHEWQPGKFEWSGQADAAEFCRIAQEEGLYVILRPGPYACAEWEMGGLPWWLLKNPSIELRSRDPRFMAASRAWLNEVGRVLAPLQVTRGGPILMVQVENEYGFLGKDLGYLEALRDVTRAAGFEVPLFVCNPVSQVSSPAPAGVFKVVNFGKDPASAFQVLRQTQPTGPLMCGEFYPGWFDTWGAPHHRGDMRQYLADLGTMLSRGASFSMYMAHGGTTFGLWSGLDRPFKPDTTSYDYDAPIGEAGNLGEKFQPTRALLAAHLAAGESLPLPPAPVPSAALPGFVLEENAELLANLPAPVADTAPRPMEDYDQGRGAILYRTELAPGPAGVLEVDAVHDFGFVTLDGAPVGIMDRRLRNFRLALPARARAARLDLLVYALGRVNFGPEISDHKGINGAVRVTTRDGSDPVRPQWQVFRFPLEGPPADNLAWKRTPPRGAAYWRGQFTVTTPVDTFLDLHHWGFGVVWVNGHCLGRFWNIGPTQTLYLPAPWLQAGKNEIAILDLVGPREARLSGRAGPILDELHPELDFSPRPRQAATLDLAALTPVHRGSFAPGGQEQEVRFSQPVRARQICWEFANALDGKAVAAVAELDLFDAQGRALPHQAWTIPYASSAESGAEDGAALNAIDGQTANAWISAWSSPAADYPHHLVLDLGARAEIAGFRYTPRAGATDAGRPKDYRVLVGEALVPAPLPPK